MKTIVTCAAFASMTAVALPALAATRQVAGTLLYEDFTPGGVLIGTKPIANVTVTLKCGAVSLGTVTTSSTGSFSKWVEQSDLPGGSTLHIEFQSRNYASDVYLDLDWFNDRLTWQRDVWVPDAWSTVDASKTVMKADFSVHFNILDAIQTGRMYADARRSDGDDITQVDVQYPDADWSKYSSFWDEITLSGMPAFGYGGSFEHGFEDGVILHEFGHHLEYDISDVDGPVHEDHGACSAFGYEFAWKEGFPTYYAEAVHQAFPAKVVEGWDNVEVTPGCPTADTEAATWAVLWDVHDGLTAGEPFDRIDGATLANNVPVRDLVFEIFDKELDDTFWLGNTFLDPSTNIKSFHDAFVARHAYPGSHADVDRILREHGISAHALGDYAVTTVSASPSPMVTGSSATVTVGLSNSGVAYADEGVELRIRLIWGEWGGSSLLLGSYGLAAFTGSKTVVQTVAVPAWLAEGQFWLNVEIDPTDRLPETNESNNGVWLDVGLTPCPHAKCAEGVALVAGGCGACVWNICQADAYCCDNWWDSICVDEVRTVCGSLTCGESAGSCQHTLCSAGVALAPACDAADANCVSTICGADPYCCNGWWDDICIGEVSSLCGKSCN